MDEDNGAEGENMRAKFINKVESKNMEQDFVLLSKHELHECVRDLHHLGPRFQHFLREFELPSFLPNVFWSLIYHYRNGQSKKLRCIYKQRFKELDWIYLSSRVDHVYYGTRRGSAKKGNAKKAK